MTVCFSFSPPNSSAYFFCTAVNSSNPYFRSMTPSLTNTHRDPSHGRDPRYYTPTSYGGSSSAQPGYASPSHHYPSQYLPPTDTRQLPLHRTPQSPQQFIPTPSEIAHSYNYNHTILTASIPEENYPPSGDYPPGSHTLPSSHGGQRPSRISTGRPRSGSVSGVASPTSASSPSGERFPCEVCGKTFSRSHDRKRHHETQHAPMPITHKCPYCVKGFSR